MSRHTDVVVILDRSGSMSTLKNDVEGGFDRMIREQGQVEGTCNVTLVQFDSPGGAETVYTGKPVHEVPALVLEPRGGTPLLDALGATINQVTAQIAQLPKEHRPEQVIVIVITDGEENSSHEFKLADVRKLIEQRQRDGWTFVYLGANVDAFAEAGSLGISVMSAAPYDANAGGVKAMFTACSANLGEYRERGSYSFTDDQRQQMAGSQKLTVPPMKVNKDGTVGPVVDPDSTADKVP